MSRILVVEDDPGVRMTIVDWLDAAGYQAVAAQDAASGLKAFEQADPRPIAALLDIKLPGENGFWLCDQLKERFGFERVIFITAFFWEEETRLELAERGNPYFEKPLKFQEQVLPFLEQYLAQDNEGER